MRTIVPNARVWRRTGMAVLRLSILERVERTYSTKGDGWVRVYSSVLLKDHLYKGLPLGFKKG